MCVYIILKFIFKDFCILIRLLIKEFRTFTNKRFLIRLVTFWCNIMFSIKGE